MNEILKLKDKELLEKFGVLVREEREVIASVILHLSEIGRRKLYALEGYSSLFSYCVEKYHYSEGAAYRRIQSSRVYQKFPEVLELLKQGKLNLMTLSLIEPHLDQEKGRGGCQPEGKKGILRNVFFSFWHCCKSSSRDSKSKDRVCGR